MLPFCNRPVSTSRDEAHQRGEFSIQRGREGQSEVKFEIAKINEVAKEGCNEVHLRGRREVPTAVPGHRQQKLRQNLIVRLLKTHPLMTILENQQKRNVLVTRPCGGRLTY